MVLKRKDYRTIQDTITYSKSKNLNISPSNSTHNELIIHFCYVEKYLSKSNIQEIVIYGYILENTLVSSTIFLI